jgi:hypothetical protein
VALTRMDGGEAPEKAQKARDMSVDTVKMS